MLSSDICIIGAGPAGSTMAARMAEFGHRVCLIERSLFPRAHVGESLTPGVLPLLELTGARDAVEAAGFRPVRSLRVQWEKELQWCPEPGQQGLLVDRGRLDALLVERAKALGVRVLQPARLREQNWDGDSWHLLIATADGAINSRTRFLADASGRASALRARRRFTGCRTLALYAYWRGQRLPSEPRIEAGNDAWYWGVPLPDGSYNTLVFMDFKQMAKTAGVLLETRFDALLGQSGLMAGCESAFRATAVFATDATAYVDEACITTNSIRVGDAALAIDPLSSSGVQKAIQIALAGAVATNTLLRRSASAPAAIRFFQESVTAASEAHGRWAAEHYQRIAQRGGGPFWQARASVLAPSVPQRAHGQRLRLDTQVEISPLLEFVEQPCIEGQFVTLKTAIRHPNLERPVAFLGGHEIAPLMRHLRSGLTPAQVAHSWSSGISKESGLALLGWLVDHGILLQNPA